MVSTTFQHAVTAKGEEDNVDNEIEKKRAGRGGWCGEERSRESRSSRASGGEDSTTARKEPVGILVQAGDTTQ